MSRLKNACIEFPLNGPTVPAPTIESGHTMSDLHVRVSRTSSSVTGAVAVVALLLGGVFFVGSARTAQAGAATTPAAGSMVPLVPARVADSRIFQWFPTFHASEEQDLSIVGRGGVPTTGVAGVVLNVTAVNPRNAGFLTVWPWGLPRPSTSNVNFSAHQTIANTVIVKVSADGTISFFNGSAGDTDILVDVEGYIAA